MEYWDDENEVYYCGDKFIVKTRYLVYGDFIESLTAVSRLNAGLLKFDETGTQCENELVEDTPASIAVLLKAASNQSFIDTFNRDYLMKNGITMTYWFANSDDAAYFKLRWG